nr:hypothetical protein [Tanacetum cinerariifolium]
VIIIFGLFYILSKSVTLSWKATRVLESGTTVVEVLALVVVGVGINVDCCREGKSEESREVMVVAEAVVTVLDGLMKVCLWITEPGMVRSVRSLLYGSLTLI